MDCGGRALLLAYDELGRRRVLFLKLNFKMSRGIGLA